MRQILGGLAVLLALSWPMQGQKRAVTGPGGERAVRQFPTAGTVTQLPWTLATTIPASMETEPESSRAGAKVSVAELQIPAAALKELRIFQEKFAAGKLEDASKHAERAIRIYPQLGGAHYNLGLCYARLNQYDKAIVELQTAAELDARLVPPRVTLAELFLIQGKYSEGEAAARSALDLDPVNTVARYFLARNLVSAGQETAEVVELLEKSREEFPGARLSLANIYLKKNATDDAVKELREYLQQPNASQKDRIACMVDRLTQANLTSTCAAK
jgi:tetratricopeptide (TPR) repeat protein